MIYLQNATGVVLGLSEAKGNKVPAHYQTDGTKTVATVGEETVTFLQNAARTIYTVVYIVDTWYYTTNAKFDVIKEFTFKRLEDKPKAPKADPKPKAEATPVAPAVPLVLSPAELEKRSIVIIKKAKDINEVREESGAADIVADVTAISEAEVDAAGAIIDAISEAVDSQEEISNIMDREVAHRKIDEVAVKPQAICAQCKKGKHTKCTGVTSGMHACECNHPKKADAAKK